VTAQVTAKVAAPRVLQAASVPDGGICIRTNPANLETDKHPRRGSLVAR